MLKALKDNSTVLRFYCIFCCYMSVRVISLCSKFRKAYWEENDDLCDSIRHETPYNNGKLLLDMIDAHTFDFLSGMTSLNLRHLITFITFKCFYVRLFFALFSTVLKLCRQVVFQPSFKVKNKYQTPFLRVKNNKASPGDRTHARNVTGQAMGYSLGRVIRLCAQYFIIIFFLFIELFFIAE